MSEQISYQKLGNYIEMQIGRKTYRMPAPVEVFVLRETSERREEAEALIKEYQPYAKILILPTNEDGSCKSVSDCPDICKELCDASKQYESSVDEIPFTYQTYGIPDYLGKLSVLEDGKWRVVKNLKGYTDENKDLISMPNLANIHSFDCTISKHIEPITQLTELANYLGGTATLQHILQDQLLKAADSWNSVELHKQLTPMAQQYVFSQETADSIAQQVIDKAFKQHVEIGYGVSNVIRLEKNNKILYGMIPGDRENANFAITFGRFPDDPTYLDDHGRKYQTSFSIVQIQKRAVSNNLSIAQQLKDKLVDLHTGVSLSALLQLPKQLNEEFNWVMDVPKDQPKPEEQPFTGVLHITDTTSNKQYKIPLSYTTEFVDDSQFAPEDRAQEGCVLLGGVLKFDQKMFEQIQHESTSFSKYNVELQYEPQHIVQDFVSLNGTKDQRAKSLLRHVSACEHAWEHGETDWMRPQSYQTLTRQEFKNMCKALNRALAPQEHIQESQSQNSRDDDDIR